MLNHDAYARAFYQATQDNPIADSLTLFALFKALTPLVPALLFDPDKRHDILDVIEPKRLRRFIEILIEDRIIDQTPAIANSLRSCLIQEGLWTHCLIETASPVEPTAVQALLTQHLTGYLEIEHRINPELKSGLRVYVNDALIDLSLQGRLEKVKEVSHG